MEIRQEVFNWMFIYLTELNFRHGTLPCGGGELCHCSCILVPGGSSYKMQSPSLCRIINAKCSFSLVDIKDIPTVPFMSCSVCIIICTDSAELKRGKFLGGNPSNRALHCGLLHVDLETLHLSACLSLALLHRPALRGTAIRDEALKEREVRFPKCSGRSA